MCYGAKTMHFQPKGWRGSGNMTKLMRPRSVYGVHNSAAKIIIASTLGLVKKLTNS